MNEEFGAEKASMFENGRWDTFYSSDSRDPKKR